jgi:hypothetical protein
MPLYLQNIKKIIAFAFMVLALTAVSVTTVQLNAAEFYPKDEDGENVSISSTRENVYAAGNTVTVDEPIGQDVIAAGNTVTINNSVGRSAMLAGNEIKIEDQIIRGAVRAAGNEVTVEGDFGEELIVTGGIVEIKNSRIQGDLVVAAGQLTLENTVIDGDAMIAVGQYNGQDLEATVAGDVTFKDGSDESKENNREAFSRVGPFFVVNEIATIIFLALVCWYLWKRRKMEVADIKFNGRFAFDMLTGLVYGILSSIVAIILLALYPIVGFSFLSFTFCLIMLSYALIPVFLGLLIKNQFNLGLKPYWVVAIVYGVLLIGFLIPILSGVLAFILFVYSFAVFGYLLRNGAMMVHHTLATDSSSSKKKADKAAK